MIRRPPCFDLEIDNFSSRSENSGSQLVLIGHIVRVVVLFGIKASVKYVTAVHPLKDVCRMNDELTDRVWLGAHRHTLEATTAFISQDIHGI